MISESKESGFKLAFLCLFCCPGLVWSPTKKGMTFKFFNELPVRRHSSACNIQMNIYSHMHVYIPISRRSHLLGRGWIGGESPPDMERAGLDWLCILISRPCCRLYIYASTMSIRFRPCRTTCSCGTFVHVLVGIGISCLRVMTPTSQR